MASLDFAIHKPIIYLNMSTSSKKKAVPSLGALRRKVNLEAVACVQPILVLQMLAGVSQTVNSGVSQSQALARTLLLSGQQRLRDLLDAAPRLHLPLEQVLKQCHADDEEPTPEETAARALIELCLGLMLHWMAETSCQRRTIGVPRSKRRVLPSFLLSYLSPRPRRARSCLCLLQA